MQVLFCSKLIPFEIAENLAILCCGIILSCNLFCGVTKRKWVVGTFSLELKVRKTKLKQRKVVIKTNSKIDGCIILLFRSGIRLN